jgi:ABC-type amino acid transport system permease subunit
VEQHRPQPESAEIATGFGFLDREAGLPIGESLIEYSPTDTYLRALLLAAEHLEGRGGGIVLATVLARWSASRGCRATGCCPRWQASTSR